MPNKMLEAALEYEEMGFSVIPIKSKEKSPPLVAWQKYQKEKADSEQIKSWFYDYPSANLAIITGKISNLFVIDCDSNDSYNFLEDYLPDNLIIPVAKTPRGGKHLCFKYPHGGNLTIGAGVIKNLDFRGEGGYFLVHPSINGNGNGYEWIIKPTRDNIPDMPEKLLEFLISSSLNYNNGLDIANKQYNNSYLNRGDNIAKTTRDNNDNIRLQEGTRDQDLFHAGHCLIKGGCEEEYMEQILRIIADNCKPPFPQNEVSNKIKSILERVKRKERNLTEEVKEYFRQQKGYTMTTWMQQGLHLTTREEQKHLIVILGRLVKEGLIESYGERRGCYRPIIVNSEKMEFIEDEIEEFPVKLPFKMNEHLSIYPKNIIIVAGDKSGGKTALLLNVAHDNQHKHEIVYLSSEMVAEEWSSRVRQLGITKKEQIRYTMEYCSENFHNRIGPEKKIYIVDYLEIYDNFWQIGKMIRDIHDKLRDGICFIGVQKKTGEALSRGAEFSMEKARLYLSLDYLPQERCSKLTIVDAKAPKLGESIRGYYKYIKIFDKIKMESINKNWRY